MINAFRKILVIAITLGLMMVGSAYGADEERLSSVTPDNPLYVDKVISEAIDAALTTDPEEKAFIFLKMADERINELETMVALGKTKYVEGLIRSYIRIRERAMEAILKRIREMGGDESKILERLRKATEKHIRVLKRVLSRVPEPAKSTIRRVIRECTEQRRRIMSRLEKLKGTVKEKDSQRGRRGGDGKGKIEGLIRKERQRT